MEKTKVTKDLDNKTLIIERSFDAPKEKLWKAYSEQSWFEKWWGPEGWETTTKEFNFTPGGRIHYGMKCVDKNQGEWYGKESWGLMVIEAIDAGNSFSAKDYFSKEDGSIVSDKPTQRLEVEFIEENGKTRVINRSMPESVEQLEELIKMGMIQGFESQLNKLEALLPSLS
jgi:uncharacterized protein YndB with AHSA1/START domain